MTFNFQKKKKIECLRMSYRVKERRSFSDKDGERMDSSQTHRLDPNHRLRVYEVDPVCVVFLRSESSLRRGS